MSADNYAIVRKKEGGWYWGVFHASCDRDTPNEDHPDHLFDHGPFPSKEEAVNNAYEDRFLEYGVEVDSSGDQEGP